MPDPEKKRTSRAAPAAHMEQGPNAQAESGPGGTPPSQSDPVPREPTRCTRRAPASADPGLRLLLRNRPRKLIDLDAVRADERNATLAYLAEAHELCALAGRGDLAASFVAKVTPVAQVRRGLLEARAADDEATTIRSQARGSFEYWGIVFEEYRGRVGTVDFTDASKAYFFPVGVPGLFRQYNAPADFVETANTIGLPRYAKQAVDQQFARWVMLHVQSNPLPICTRPRVLIKGKRT